MVWLGGIDAMLLVYVCTSSEETTTAAAHSTAVAAPAFAALPGLLLPQLKVRD